MVAPVSNAGRPTRTDLVQEMRMLTGPVDWQAQGCHVVEITGNWVGN